MCQLHLGDALHAGNTFIRLSFTILILLLVESARAEPMTFLITDPQGRPLENAVLMGPPAQVQAPQSVAIMDQIHKTFVPHVLVIRQGQKVQFPNSDNIRHHVYSFSPAKTFEIQLYAGVPKAPLTFGKPGIVVLGCNIHDSMLGYIVVADSPIAGKAGADGKITLDIPAGMTRLRLWHPLLKDVMKPLDVGIPLADATGIRHFTLTITQPPPRDADATFGNMFKSYGR